MPPETLLARAYRFGRAIIVGSCSSLCDFVVLTVLVRVVEVAPAQARLPALLTGACVQFVGSRLFTFRARAGRLTRQLKLFLLVESLTLALNWSVFQLLLRQVRGLPPELLGIVGTGLVFVTFAYPLRRLVIFRLPRPLVDPSYRD